jgi:hypothetical protein
MKRFNHRLSFGLGILGLAAAGTAAAFLAFASGGNAAGNSACTQVSAAAPKQANCLFVSVVPSVLSANKTGLLVVSFKNKFSNATATHTVLTAVMPSGTSVIPLNGVTTTANATCSQQSQTVSCSFGSGVPGGSIVSMYIRFTILQSATSPLGPVNGSVSFDEGNGGTNDTFFTDSGATAIVGAISPGGQGGAQGGLCEPPSNLSQTGFNTTSGNGQQANIGDLPTSAPGLPCTPVSAGVVPATNEENAACVARLGVACPADTAFVFFPVLANNAAAVLTVNYPTVPSFVTGGWKNTPLFEFLADPQPGDPGHLTLIQLVKCGVTPNPSPDSCLLGDPKKFGSQGVSFSVSVTGSLLDGRLSP